MQARSALFTLFGDVILPAGGEAWLSVITAAMGTLDVNPQAVRTALHRMTAEGWVEPRREGRYSAYRLTARGVARLEDAAERIYRLRSMPWDGLWRLLLWPELAADSDTAAELRWIGFGHLQPGVWISPHDHDDAVAVLTPPSSPDLGSRRRRGAEGGDLGIGGGERAPVRFTRAGTLDDIEVAHRAWDLSGLRDQHESFLALWSDRVPPADPAEGFAMRLRLVHHWRSFLFSDPGLPAEVLPADWPGHQAAEVFRWTYESLLDPSWAWFDQVRAGSAPVATQRPPLTPAANPFAAGLAALNSRAIEGHARSGRPPVQPVPSSSLPS